MEVKLTSFMTCNNYSTIIANEQSERRRKDGEAEAE